MNKFLVKIANDMLIGFTLLRIRIEEIIQNFKR